MAFVSILSHLPKRSATRALNVVSFILRKDWIIHYDGTLFFQQRAASRHYFSVFFRGVDFYWNGFDNRASLLFLKYTQGHVILDDGDIVIDCGANWGDFYIGAKFANHNIKYIGFEPSPAAFRVLCCNADHPNSLLLNIALSNTEGHVEFFLKDDTADSSLIQPESYQEKVTVNSLTLDGFLESRNISKVKLLKLEAEGFEPEVLQGSLASLRKIRYIAADCGYERGVDAEETLSSTASILCSSGFRLLAVDYDSRKALFENKTPYC